MMNVKYFLEIQENIKANNTNISCLPDAFPLKFQSTWQVAAGFVFSKFTLTFGTGKRLQNFVIEYHHITFKSSRL